MISILEQLTFHGGLPCRNSSGKIQLKKNLDFKHCVYFSDIGKGKNINMSNVAWSVIPGITLPQCQHKLDFFKHQNSFIQLEKLQHSLDLCDHYTK